MDKGKRIGTDQERWSLMGQRLYGHAQVDMESAVESLRPRRYHNAVAYAQQAAEKSLKAAHWHLLGEEPKHTHNLEIILTSIARAVDEVPNEIAVAVGALAGALEESLYPSGDVDEPIPPDSVTESDARAALAHAERVMVWVEPLLRRPTGKPKRRKSS